MATKTKSKKPAIKKKKVLTKRRRALGFHKTIPEHVYMYGWLGDLMARDDLDTSMTILVDVARRRYDPLKIPVMRPSGMLDYTLVELV